MAAITKLSIIYYFYNCIEMRGFYKNISEYQIKIHNTVHHEKKLNLKFEKI